MARKKRKPSRRAATGPKGQKRRSITVFRLVNCTISPGCIRALRSRGLSVDEVLLKEGSEAVTLVEPGNWEQVIAHLLRRRPRAIIMVNSVIFDDEMTWLAVAELLRIPILNWFCKSSPTVLTLLFPRWSISSTALISFFSSTSF